MSGNDDQPEGMEDWERMDLESEYAEENARMRRRRPNGSWPFDSEAEEHKFFDDKNDRI